MRKTYIMIAVLSGFAAQAQTQTATCVERGRKAGETCFMASRPERKCDRDCLDADYYTDFSGAGDVFNLPSGSSDCLPWRFLLSGNNCRDNPNFNPAQYCNTANPKYPYASYPRVEVVGGGRLGGPDRCVRITCFPGDHYRAEKRNGRAEMLIRPAIAEGESSWFAWSFRLPEGFVLDNGSTCPDQAFRYTHCAIAQIHTTEKGKCDQADRPFTINLRSTKRGLAAVVRFGALCGPARTEGNRGRFDVVPGRWYDVVMRIAWSADPSVASFEFQAWEEGIEEPVFSTSVTGTRSLFRNAGNGYGIFHLGAYTGKNFCNPVSLAIDEFSFSKEKRCLKSPRVQGPCPR